MDKLKDASQYDKWWGKNGNIFESETLAIDALMPEERDHALGECIRRILENILPWEGRLANG